MERRADVESLEIKEKINSNIKIAAREKTKENVDVAGIRGMKKRGDGEWGEKFELRELFHVSPTLGVKSGTEPENMIEVFVD